MPTTRRTFLNQSGLLLAGAGLHAAIPAGLLTGLTDGTLPASTPEAQGVSSQAILDFLDAVSAHRHEFHGLVIARNGYRIAEGYWAPYRAGLTHSMYSMSKSFTSTAIGFAVAEKQLGLDDKVVSFFPGKLPANPSDRLRRLSIRHLLTMSVGHSRDTTFDMIRTSDWVRAFLSYPVEKEPGTEFLYNSGATYMLSAILRQATGQNPLEWLKPRLFQPLGIQGAAWDNDPAGTNTGGWGLHLRTGDLALFGQFLLQKGKWNGRQLLPVSWIDEATAFHIQNGPESQRAVSDWAQGYGYQFWRCRHDAFRGDGAFGQYTIVLPRQQTVIAITEETPNLQGVLDLVWDILLPAQSPSPLPANPATQQQLARRLAALAIPPPAGNATSAMAPKATGTYRLAPNANGMETLSVSFGNDECKLLLKGRLGSFSLQCGYRTWRKGTTRLPGTPPSLFPLPYDLLATSPTMGSGAWTDPETFVITLYYTETAHHDTITCRFRGDTATVSFKSSVTAILGDFVKDPRVTLEGRKG